VRDQEQDCRKPAERSGWIVYCIFVGRRTPGRETAPRDGRPATRTRSLGHQLPDQRRRVQQLAVGPLNPCTPQPASPASTLGRRPSWTIQGPPSRPTATIRASSRSIAPGSTVPGRSYGQIGVQPRGAASSSRAAHHRQCRIRLPPLWPAQVRRSAFLVVQLGHAAARPGLVEPPPRSHGASAPGSVASYAIRTRAPTRIEARWRPGTGRIESVAATHSGAPHLA
jgi:hypothetical protein